MFGFIWSKLACSVGEYMQESMKADSILEQTFLDRERWNIGTGILKLRKKIYSPQYTSDHSVKSQLSCTIRKRTTASDWTVPYSHVCFRHLPCSGFVLTKTISVFLESTNIRRVNLLMTVNFRFYARLFHVWKFENQSPVVDKQVIRIQTHWTWTMK